MRSPSRNRSGSRRGQALVLVTAELPPFQKPGTRLDVTVSAIGDARSLAGGELQLTDLRGPLGRRDPTIYALASGRLVVEGDEGRGNPTVGFIPGGAVVEKGLAHAFVHEIPAGRPGKSLRGVADIARAAPPGKPGKLTD